MSKLERPYNSRVFRNKMNRSIDRRSGRRNEYDNHSRNSNINHPKSANSRNPNDKYSRNSKYYSRNSNTSCSSIPNNNPNNLNDPEPNHSNYKVVNHPQNRTCSQLQKTVETKRVPTNTHCSKPSPKQPQALVQNFGPNYIFFPEVYPVFFYSIVSSQVSLINFRKSFLNYLEWFYPYLNEPLRLFYLEIRKQVLDKKKISKPTFGPIFYEDPRDSRTIADIHNEGRQFANPAHFVQDFFVPQLKHLVPYKVYQDRRHLYDVTRCNGTMFYNRQNMKIPNDYVYQGYLFYINSLRPPKNFYPSNREVVLCDSESEDEDDQMLSFDAIGCVVMWDGGTVTENEPVLKREEKSFL